MTFEPRYKVDDDRVRDALTLGKVAVYEGHIPGKFVVRRFHKPQSTEEWYEIEFHPSWGCGVSESGSGIFSSTRSLHLTEGLTTVGVCTESWNEQVWEVRADEK